MTENPCFDELLVEMAYRWSDVEKRVSADPAVPFVYVDDPEGGPVPLDLAWALALAFRVEAVATENFFGDPATVYSLTFDVANETHREAADLVRKSEAYLDEIINDMVPVYDRRCTHMVRVASPGTAAEGQACVRLDPGASGDYADVAEVPVEKPRCNVPLIERDGFWLTPIEVPFYEALRETGMVFSVQPWIQGVDKRYRLDFLVFYDGGAVAVELDGHESHKTRDQRTRDARRDRWFAARRVQTLRWTGSEVHANPQDCVRQLLEVLRGSQARA